MPLVPSLPPLPVTVRVLGPITIETDGEMVESPETRRERVRALLGYLVAQPGATRTQIADALWPEDERVIHSQALRDIGFSGFASAEALPFPDPDAAARQTMAAFHRYFGERPLK